VNFALADWIGFGRLAVETYRFSRSAVFSHHEYIVKAALDIINENDTDEDKENKTSNNINFQPCIDNINNQKKSSNNESQTNHKKQNLQPYDRREFFTA
jgi:hypothetical protein